MTRLKLPTCLIGAIVLVLASAPAFAAPTCTANANVSPNNQSVNENTQVTLNAASSAPNGGQPIAYLWTQTAGPSVVLSNATAVKPTFTAPSVGPAGVTLTFNLRVTGCSDSLVSNVSTNIVVNNLVGNTAPFASASVTPPSASEGATVTLSGAGSSDPDGDTLSYSWIQLSGPTVTLSSTTAISPTFVAPNTAYPGGASLQFQLTVSDGFLSAVATVTSNIVWVDDPPVAALSCPATVDEGQDITLDGSTSSDSDDGIGTYAWAQLLGPPYISVSGLTTPSITVAAPVLGLGQTGFVPFRLTVTDVAGQSSQTECTVQVMDVTKPVLSGASDLTVEATSAGGAVATYSVTAFDNVDGDSLATCSPESGGSFPIGDTTVNCSKTDSANNTGTASFTVTVVDTTGPVIAHHDDVTEEATSAAGAISNYTLPPTSDAVDGAGTASCSPAPGSQFELGTNAVACNATDGHGNAAAPTGFNVLVQDTIAPSITPPPSQTFEATGLLTPLDSSDYGTPVVTDAVGVDEQSNDAPASFPLGPTTITWFAKDTSGNTSTAATEITVVDTTAPSFDPVLADIDAEATSASGAAVSFNATATDLVDASVEVACTPVSGSIFPLGSTQVDCTATDDAGNVGNGTFHVIVADTTQPVFNAGSYADITTEATSGSGAVASFNPTASDAVDASVGIACSPASGSTFALGTTNVACTATDDAGNVGHASFDVVVQDTTAPVVTVPANISLEATGPSGAAAGFTVTASDIVDGSVATSCSPASGSTFALGTTTVDCSATDAHGNTGSGGFTVTVVDSTGPAIAAHADVNAIATSASGTVVSYTLPTATDLVDGSVPVTCVPASGAMFAAGSTTVNCTSTDSHGNTSTSSFKVIVSYNWTGFFSPVDNLPVVNVVKAGQAIPVKFSLGGNMGLSIFAAGYPTSGATACSVTVSDAIEETVTAGGSALSYGGGQYVYVWKTEKSWSGCRTLVLKMSDGTVHTALFNFTR
jgi:hypothetical protein